MKIKWLEIKSDYNVSQFINLFSNNSFNRKSTKGFIIESFTKQEVHTTFIEKKTTQVSIIDPFGNEKIEDRVNYTKIELKLKKLNDIKSEILIYDPPRTIKPLFDFLLCETDLDFSISKVDFDINKFISLIKSKHGSRSITIRSIVAENVFITKDSSAKMTLKSSKGKALSDLKKKLNLSTINLSHAVIDMKSNELTDTIEISKSGYLTGNYQEYLENIGRGLLKA